MPRYEEEEYLLLSGIQHFEFCRRQWALIHIEQQWAENYRTTAGELMHKKAHEEMSVEKRGKLLIMRGLRIASASLGISGQCDVVEFHQRKQGINLEGYDGLWQVVPVEYKRGTKKDGLEDEVQLCAQAICLEEMFLTEISKGYLFYGENKRREEVAFTSELRSHVEEICEEMHRLYKRGYTPKVKTTKKCRSCSLKDLCLPKLNKNLDVTKYINDQIGEAGEGE
ncbi:CRISPR-associated protein Cas4 [Ihubacter massiliensis]|uniref:CRISPR-associated exonuclease Cas4 n=1 Tax=Hominibacterium faecale TaxID=2839743 RepID=A0A9J6QKU1_9FIRM|nr:MULTISPECIES: CRISPR-associated protein Cas4 [Eubacteriales Family XIII. Incertae Sedis]MCC2865440.1 CRISPR-associated protein Cas4 [Anaerovorax odorimutans]MCI7303724.1 CRISPR-associated protein Cas4 [Clostridia bacterium]MDE8732980.1 CRISPR-associated protein Cas4 [Eubacteriales bacterium DFI.9.88]MDY3012085.1 CRISPR-associated protein Cas4 [Clostridiales Family XIII bacterium]MCO7120836.1 CRISPR-associated protein Cas4 [Ihubacter massiliensis]